MRHTPHVAFVILTVVFGACAPKAPVDLAAEREALLALHERILDAHRTDNLDDWLALEADTVVVGSRGELFRSPKSESAGMRRNYLAAAEFSAYRDLQPPIVHVSGDGSLGWVFAQVEIVGRYLVPDTTSIHDVWAWVELYERRPEGWRLVGNVSTAKP
ncbi:MAG TPA: hypothetical protein VEC56_10505 [Candidatus Krumholzibacteria bacterium]|nr:hypothetical protein [Candidatus Krumholzibacteria bacterium]